MSFLKRLFGGGGGGASAEPPGPGGAKTIKQLEHGGYLIEARPYPVDGQYQVAGLISRSVDGARREHVFVRADRCAAIEDAAEIAIRKGCQIVDQQGDRMFAP
jgi:hypothetical protein